jgi:pimeloyl-ACP methyl ester carboxylesterase
MVAVLNHEVSGDRRSPAVLFLHGFMGSSADWREIMTVIGDQTFRIAVDLPGHGASLGLPPDTYTIEGATRAVIRTMDGLEVTRPVVAGYSMGGRLALYLALRYQERCTGLFLESASPGLESEQRGALRMSRRQSAWNRKTSRRFFRTGTASHSSRLWRGTRTCSIGPSRRSDATILASLLDLFGEWGRGASRRCGESWNISLYRLSLSQEAWMRSTPGSHRAWRA